jgi:hypothetical protein
MAETSLTLPFITGANGQKEDLSYTAEIACIAFLVETQRKKTSFLRDRPERIEFISKVHYPFWIAPTGNSCIIIDGLNNTKHEFSFHEPNKIPTFIEELRRNSASPQNFSQALQAQAKAIKEVTSKVQHSFQSLLSDPELLSFFLEKLRNGVFEFEKLENQAQIQAETDWKTATQTAQAFVNCVRTVQANAKGLQYALSILKEEVDFHKNGSENEVALLKEKREKEIEKLKPFVDQNVKRLLQKRDKALSTLQKSIDRRISTLDRKREKSMRRLLLIEQRKSAAQHKVNIAKKRSSPMGSFALKKYQKEIDRTKDDIKSISKETEDFKKNGESNLKAKEDEFQVQIAKEEDRLTQISAVYDARINANKTRIDDMVVQATTISRSLENQIDQLNRDGNLLRSKVAISWKTETPDDLIFVQLPIYLASYGRDKEERVSLISPLTYSNEMSALNGIKKMLALSPDPKLKTITRPMNERLHEILTTNVVERIQRDPDFKGAINQICRANNLMNQNDFASILNEGFDEIEKKGWMTSLEAQAFCKRIMGEEV